ncbi:hypothetical protein AKJ37_01275 [candidate division MSBL1 archaeon SCGC-AAA259I09]|uniref:2-(3-amino-3-carboxypropyl)histidine synthase n=2 Tax=candidate division MSBL1 TaxID=215777 RepID=A0A133UV90_9EURY|nr:hypothetical protein AKJ37_01275 [candidate division MSBL1 archaeon SCGC-AAA259I09]KXB00807.1 hypothetical protein AKJ40_00525 [candidate division MSBL1 archaeon SCGC-AAA259M10]
MYDFEPESVKKFIEENEANKVAVQLPSGLRPYYSEIKKDYDEAGVKALFLTGSCFGACDIADREAETMECDALVHYGHADMGVPTSIPVLYVEAHMEAEPFDVLEKALPELRGSVWGLTTTVQHIDHLYEVKEVLSGEKIKSVIGDPGPRAKYPGQILGCDWGSARSVSGEVDGFIYIGTGEFHPVGIILATGKPVISINPLADDYERTNPELEKFMRKRWAVIAEAKSCQSFGVLVSVKGGQNRMSLAESLSEKLDKQGYDSCILVADDVNTEALRDFQIEAFVNTACPRLAISDEELFDGPVLTPFEAEVLIGDRDWEDYHLNGIGINFEI